MTPKPPVPLAQRASARVPAGTPSATPEGDQGPSGSFKRPNTAQFVPPEMKDAVDRIVAAGIKMAYSPQMADERQQFLEGQEPAGQRMAQTVAGLLLTLDQQAKGGLPVGAIFPAGVELLGEAAEMLSKAGQPVSQEDFNDGARQLFVIVGQKLGGTPDQIMQAAGQAAGEGEPTEPADAPHGEMPAAMG